MTVTEGVLGIRDFALGVEGAKSAPIDIASLEASALTVDMAARKVIVGRLVSRKARIEAVRLRDGSIDLAALFDGADKDAAPAASDAQAPWLVENGRLELADWTIRMEDRTSAPHSQMLASKVALSVDGLSSRADAPLKVSLDGRINRRGQLRVSGTLVPAPFAADLKLDLGGVDLLPLQQFLTEKTNVLITHGALAAAGGSSWPAADVESCAAATPAAPPLPISLRWTGSIRPISFVGANSASRTWISSCCRLPYPWARSG